MAPAGLSPRRREAKRSSPEMMMSPSGELTPIKRDELYTAITPSPKKRRSRSPRRRSSEYGRTSPSHTPRLVRSPRSHRRRRSSRAAYYDRTPADDCDCDFLCCLDDCLCGWWMRPCGRCLGACLTRGVVGWLLLLAALPLVWVAATNEMVGLVGAILTCALCLGDAIFITGLCMAMGEKRWNLAADRWWPATLGVGVGFVLLVMRQPVGLAVQLAGLFFEPLRELPWRKWALRLQQCASQSGRLEEGGVAEKLLQRASGFKESGV